MPARCARAAPRGLGRRRRPGLRGGRQRHGQRWQAIQPRLRRVGASAAVRRRATGKRSQYGHAHDLAPGRRAGGLRQAILRHCVTSRSGWRGQLDGCAVLIQKRHPGWRHGALPGTSSTVTAGLDPAAAGASMRRKSIRSGRSDRRPGCVSSQRNKGSARASSRLRRQRHPGRAPSRRPANRPAPGRGAATLPSPGRARFAHEARWPAMFPARCSSRAGASVRRARARPWPAQARSAPASTARPAPAGAAGQHAALARRQSEPIIPGARAPVRDALAPCRERRRRQGPEREAHERLAGAAPWAARGAGQPPAWARRIRRPGRRLDPVRRAPSGAGSRRAPGAISTSNAPSA